jgi:hypothetical protein
MKFVNALLGFVALSAIVRRRSPVSGGGSPKVCDRRSPAGFGSGGFSAGFAGSAAGALGASLGWISFRNSSRMSPSAVKIRLSVTLISGFSLASFGNPPYLL